MTELIDRPPDTAITDRFGLVDEPAIGFPLILWLVESAAANLGYTGPHDCQEVIVDIPFATPIA
jgi:hypothetical protein